MARYVAFLRAINVGGRTVRMEQLRTVFEGLGFSAVSTFIASGNVRFETRARDRSRLEQKIAAALQRALGYDVATFLRTPDELAAVMAAQPFGDDAHADGAKLHIGFLHAPPENAAALEHYDTDFERVRLVGRELYWLIRGRMSDSRITGGLLEKQLRAPLTLRNANTVRKLAGS